MIAHGGLSILRRHAEKCLPLPTSIESMFFTLVDVYTISGLLNSMVDLQDMSQNPPSQELVAKDLHGTEWHFLVILQFEHSV